MTPEPRFSGPAPGGGELVPVALDFETQGHFLVFRLRVDGTNLEPSAGSCRRWFLQRVAREAESAPRSFCHDDSVRFRVAAGVEHSLDLVVGSEHTVAKRVVLRPGEDVRWRMPITTGPVKLRIDLEPGYAYAVEAREESLDLRRALAPEAPRGTRWDLDAHEAVFSAGVEVGRLRIRLLRGLDREVVSELSAPLYSGRMRCEPPFCE